MKFYIGRLYENISRKFIFFKIGQKYGTLNIQNQVIFILETSVIARSPSFKGMWYQFCYVRRSYVNVFRIC